MEPIGLDLGRCEDSGFARPAAEVICVTLAGCAVVGVDSGGLLQLGDGWSDGGTAD